MGSLVLLAVLVIGVAGLYWRLSQGPVSLSFLQARIEQAVNTQLAGLTITLGDAVLELDTESQVPHVRSRNLVLKDQDGTVLASAPKAGVTLNGSQLLSGKVVVTSLELIGPRVNARRNLDGSVQLGIGAEAASAEEVTVVDEGEFLAPDEQALRRNHSLNNHCPRPAGRASSICWAREARLGHLAISTTSRSRVLPSPSSTKQTTPHGCRHAPT